MEKVEYQKLFDNEDEHFYYVSLHKLILWTVNKYVTQYGVVLDAGCGTAGLTERLSKKYKVSAVDSSLDAVRLAKRRNLNVIRASVDKLPFRSNHFDAITCIDVLYHKNVNQSAALKEFHRVLKPNGYLIMRVPANPSLYTIHDKNVHTRKRYTKHEVRELMNENHFQITRLSYMNLSLLVPALIFPDSSLGKLNRFLNAIFLLITNLENYFLRYFNLPQGIGIYCVARKTK